MPIEGGGSDSLLGGVEQREELVAADLHDRSRAQLDSLRATRTNRSVSRAPASSPFASLERLYPRISAIRNVRITDAGWLCVAGTRAGISSVALFIGSIAGRCQDLDMP
jgi:hypothetical protein